MFDLGASKFWIFIDKISINLNQDKHYMGKLYYREWIFSRIVEA